MAIIQISLNFLFQNLNWSMRIKHRLILLQTNHAIIVFLSITIAVTIVIVILLRGIVLSWLNTFLRFLWIWSFTDGGQSKIIFQFQSMACWVWGRRSLWVLVGFVLWGLLECRWLLLSIRIRIVGWRGSTMLWLEELLSLECWLFVARCTRCGWFGHWGRGWLD